MKNYQGYTCPVCHAKLFEDDDVVVCPECGAPHHRDCYAAIGHCAFSDDHGTSRQWTPPKENVREESPHDETKICGKCGRKSAEDTLFCPYCGQPFGQPGKSAGPEAATPPFGQFFPGADPTGFGGAVYDPFGGVNPEEKIEDVPVREVATFVAVNTPRYIPVFKKLSTPKKKRVGWNWSAFLLPECWLFYRKCYKPGLLAAFIAVASGLLTTPFVLAFNNIISRLPEEHYSQQQLIAYFMEHYTEVPSQTILFTIAGIVLMLAVRVIFGLFGDSLYKTHALKKIRIIRKETNDAQRRLQTLKQGSVNLYYALGAYAGVSVLSSFLQSFIS